MKQTYFENFPGFALLSPAEAEALDREERQAHRNRLIVLACVTLVAFGGWMLG